MRDSLPTEGIRSTVCLRILAPIYTEWYVLCRINTSSSHMVACQFFFTLFLHNSMQMTEGSGLFFCIPHIKVRSFFSFSLVVSEGLSAVGRGEKRRIWREGCCGVSSKCHLLRVSFVRLSHLWSLLIRAHSSKGPISESMSSIKLSWLVDSVLTHVPAICLAQWEHHILPMENSTITRTSHRVPPNADHVHAHVMSELSDIWFYSLIEDQTISWADWYLVLLVLFIIFLSKRKLEKHSSQNLPAESHSRGVVHLIVFISSFVHLIQQQPELFSFFPQAIGICHLVCWFKGLLLPCIIMQLEWSQVSLRLHWNHEHAFHNLLLSDGMCPLK